jgi:hypothetical protein
MKLSDGDLIGHVRAFVARAWKPRPLAPPLTVPQLYAIARRVYEPSIDDGEWSARIKDAVAKDGATPAQPHDISAAMSAMSRKLRRPDPIIFSPSPRQRQFHDSMGTYLSRTEAARLLAEIERRAGATRG